MLVAIKTADVGWPFPKAFESSCTITLQSALDKSIALFGGTIHWGNYLIYQVLVILRYSMIQLKGLICLEACSNPQSWHSEEVVPLSPWCPMVSHGVPKAPCCTCSSAQPSVFTSKYRFFAKTGGPHSAANFAQLEVLSII